MSTWKTTDFEHPLVSVRCITYNHEPYIAQALDGFMMQVTDFPFEVIVHDDASTDRTADIIREYEAKYPKIIKAIYETENQYSKHDGSLRRIINAACKGKYIAFCEGDDYWIVENKLQMQVDFLENDTNISLVYTNFNCVDVNSQIINRTHIEALKELSKSGDVFFNLLKKNFIFTLTCCFRREVILSKLTTEAPVSQDYLLFLVASALGKVIYQPEKTSCYRQTPSSLMSTQSRAVWENNASIFFYIKKLYKAKKLPNRNKLLQQKINFIFFYRSLKLHYYFLKQKIKKYLIKKNLR